MSNKVQAVPGSAEAASAPSKDVNKSASASKEGGEKPAENITKSAGDATDKDLADTIDHAREVTKSQESGSRKHSQKAEDEMSETLKK